MRTRPLPNEYHEYYDRYVQLVPDGDIEELLRKQHSETSILLKNVSEDVAAASYAPGKWTLKEVVGHIADIERVMTYRMFATARNDGGALQGMDQDLYVSSANFNQLSWGQLLADLDAVRSATLSLLTTIDDEAWIRQGTLRDQLVTVRAFAYITAGHELHHQAIIRDKYLSL